MLALWSRSFWIGDQFAYSNPNYIAGVSSYGGYFWLYHGVRFMPHFDGDGFIWRSTAGPSQPAERMGNWNEVYLIDRAYGATFRCFVVEGWKLSAILFLLLLKGPLSIVERNIAQWMRAEKHQPTY